MANLAKFRSNIVAYVNNHGGLPQVVLSQKTDLGQAFSAVVCAEKKIEGESDGDAAGRYVDEFCSILGKEEYQNTVRLFDDTTAAFAEKIKSAIASIEGIRDKARDLAADMGRATDSILAKNEFYQKNIVYNEMRTDFPVFEWGATKLWGTKETLAKDVNALVVAEGQEVPTDLDARLYAIIAAPQSMTRFVGGQMTPMPITDETRSALVDQLTVALAGMSGLEITNALDTLLGIKGYGDERAIIEKPASNNPADLFANVKRLDKFVLSVYPVAEAIADGRVQLDDSLKEKLLTSAKRFIIFCKIAAYYEMMQRTTVFRDAFLLQRGMVNSDTREAFVNAGGTTQMIANYIRKMYKDDTGLIPVMGIRGDTIVNADSAIADEVAEMTNNVMTRVNAARASARASAFRMVANNYISTRFDADHSDDQTVTPLTRSTYVESKMHDVALPIADAIKQYGVNFVEASINLIVGTDYAGTFVEHLQKKLGAAYMSLVNTSINISNDDIRCVEAGVIAELIVSFVVDKIVERTTILSDGVHAKASAPKQTPEEIKQAPGAAPAQES